MDVGHLIQAHGYWVLAVGCLLEGETVLILAAVAAHSGYLDARKVVAIAAASAFAGDQLYFWAGRLYGAKALERLPRIERYRMQLKGALERWRGWAIVAARFAYGFRIAAPMLLGATRVSPGRFAFFNAIGAVSWAVAVTALGWTLGEAGKALLGDLWRIEAALLACVAVGAIAYALTHRVPAETPTDHGEAKP